MLSIIIFSLLPLITYFSLIFTIPNCPIFVFIHLVFLNLMKHHQDFQYYYHFQNCFDEWLLFWVNFQINYEFALNYCDWLSLSTSIKSFYFNNCLSVLLNSLTFGLIFETLIAIFKTHFQLCVIQFSINAISLHLQFLLLSLPSQFNSMNSIFIPYFTLFYFK